MPESTDRLLDEAHLNRLRADPRGLRELIEAFLNTIDPILDALEQARQERNESDFRQLIHALSGAALSVGARALADQCQTLARVRDPEQRLTNLRELAAGFPPTRNALLAFRGTLPVETDSPAPPDAAQKTILIVDDHPAARELLHILLNGQYRWIDADNGDAALALCEGEHRPDAALIDLNLGFSEQNSWTGLEVIQRLDRRMPAIVVTADRTRNSLHAAIQAGAWGYLHKPPDPDLLLATVATAIARAGDRIDLTAYNPLDVATGVIMAAHHLDQPEARRLIATQAMKQRRKTNDLAYDILAAQGVHNHYARAARRLSEPTDAPPG